MDVKGEVETVDGPRSEPARPTAAADDRADVTTSDAVGAGTTTARVLSREAEIVPGWAANRWGRIALSLFLILVLAAVLSANMPRSALKAAVVPWTGPVLAALGLDQNWGVFAPDPRNDTSQVIARVQYTDGSSTDRTIEAGRGLDALRDYRWRKYEEQLWSGRQAQEAWLPYGRWLTASDAASGKRVREIEMIRRTRLSLPPGPGPDYGPWEDRLLGRVTGTTR